MSAGPETQEPLVLRFELLSTAPDGVTRLRDLILTLAVKGRLVPQDASHEPATVLVDKIRRSSRQTLMTLGREECGLQVELPAEGLPFEVPSNWCWTNISSIAKVFNGNSISEQVKQSKYQGLKDGFPYIATKDVGFGLEELDYENGVRIPVAEPGFKIARRNAILICAEGGSAGRKIGIANQDVCFGNKLYASEVVEEINHKYIGYLYRSPYFAATFRQRMTGIIGGISLGQFVQIRVPVPPKPEQDEIVARVDELMRLCDALEAQGRLEAKQHARLLGTLLGTLTDSSTPEELAANWQRVAEHFDLLLDRPAAVDALEQTILQLAVRGLLVPQDTSDEPAMALLARIRVEKDQLIVSGKIRRDKPLPSVDADSAPFALPDGWAWARFPELGEFGRGKSKHRPRNDPALFSPPIYPLVQTGEVARAKGTVLEYHSKYSELGLAQSRLWPAGTLCITIAANIADAAILGFDACFPDSVVGFVPAACLGGTTYFHVFLETAKTDLVKFAPATAQKNINLEVLESLLVPVPPKLELERIVARVTQLRRLCADLRQRLAASQTTQSHLAEALVDMAVA